MPKFTDYESETEVRDIMEKFLERFPGMFEGFDTSKMGFVMTAKKKSKVPVKLHTIQYPVDVFCSSKVYIVEVFKKWWKQMDTKRKNMSVFRAMCEIPEGGFDESSKYYGKKLQPEIRMFMKEFAACGGVPNWMENPGAADPMERSAEDVAANVPAVDGLPVRPVEEETDERVPVTADTVEAVE